MYYAFIEVCKWINVKLPLLEVVAEFHTVVSTMRNLRTFSILALKKQKVSCFCVMHSPFNKYFKLSNLVKMSIKG